MTHLTFSKSPVQARLASARVMAPLTVCVVSVGLLTASGGCGGGGSKGSSNPLAPVSTATPSGTATPAAPSRGNVTFTVYWPKEEITRLIPDNTKSLIVELRPYMDGAEQPAPANLRQTIARASGETSKTIAFNGVLYGEYRIRVEARSGDNGTGTLLASATVPLLVDAKEVSPVITLSDRVDTIRIRQNASDNTETSDVITLTTLPTGTAGAVNLQGAPLDPAGFYASLAGGTFAWSLEDVNGVGVIPDTAFLSTTGPTGEFGGTQTYNIQGVRSTYVNGSSVGVRVKAVYTNGSLTREATRLVNVRPGLSNIPNLVDIKQNATRTVSVDLHRGNKDVTFKVFKGNLDVTELVGAMPPGLSITGSDGDVKRTATFTFRAPTSEEIRARFSNPALTAAGDYTITAYATETVVPGTVLAPTTPLPDTVVKATAIATVVPVTLAPITPATTGKLDQGATRAFSVVVNGTENQRARFECVYFDENGVQGPNVTNLVFQATDNNEADNTVLFTAPTSIQTRTLGIANAKGTYKIRAIATDDRTVQTEDNARRDQEVNAVTVSITTVAALNQDQNANIGIAVNGTTDKKARVFVRKGSTDVTGLVLANTLPAGTDLTKSVDVSATTFNFKPLTYTQAKNAGVRYFTDNGETPYTIEVVPDSDPLTPSRTNNQEVKRITIMANGTTSVSPVKPYQSTPFALTLGNIENPALEALTVTGGIGGSTTGVGNVGGVFNFNLVAGRSAGIYTVLAKPVADPDLSVTFQVEVKSGNVTGVVK
jgi:hypothetical protein